MKAQVECSWNGGMSFETEMDGHKIVLDATPEVGGKDLGPRPKPFMLLALAGCTGMDVISILKKMRVEVESFEVSTMAELTEEHPKKFSTIKIIYDIKGKDVPADKVKKAVSLSEERYCGISASLKPGALAISVLLETIPIWCMCIVVRFTLSDIPMSSALIITLMCFFAFCLINQVE